MFVIKIQSTISSLCRKELYYCYDIKNGVLLHFHEHLRHLISILLRKDPSGKLPVLELQMISIRCNSVINHSWLDCQPRAGSG